MLGKISEIWIEIEENRPLRDGWTQSNVNSDVIVTFIDGSRYVATFFTYDNIEYLRKKNRRTGECLNGRYFWASDMILVERINRMEIEEVVEQLIRELEFSSVFSTWK